MARKICSLHFYLNGLNTETTKTKTIGEYRRNDWSRKNTSITREEEPGQKVLDISNPKTLQINASWTYPRLFTKRDNGCEVVRCVTSCSDGEIAIIELDEVSRKFEKVFATCLNDKPVLSVSTVTVANELSSRTFLATGSTDGTVAIWNVNIVSAPLLVLKEAHQSGVNSISLNMYDQDLKMLSLVTGGDDQKVTVSIINVAAMELLKCHEVMLAHESAIRALWSDGANIVSTGLDQRVHFWGVSFRKDNIRFDGFKNEHHSSGNARN